MSCTLRLLGQNHAGKGSSFASVLFQKKAALGVKFLKDGDVYMLQDVFYKLFIMFVASWKTV